MNMHEYNDKNILQSITDFIVNLLILSYQWYITTIAIIMIIVLTDRWIEVTPPIIHMRVSAKAEKFQYSLKKKKKNI